MSGSNDARHVLTSHTDATCRRSARPFHEKMRLGRREPPSESTSKLPFRTCEGRPCRIVVGLSDWNGSAICFGLDGLRAASAALVDGAPSRLTGAGGGAVERARRSRSERARVTDRIACGDDAADRRKSRGPARAQTGQPKLACDRGSPHRSWVGATRGSDPLRLARLAYGALFVVFLPAGLLLWARATSPLVRAGHSSSGSWAPGDAGLAHRRRIRT